MAGFKEHLVVGTLVSVVTSVYFQNYYLLPLIIICSILPDIDSHGSIPSRIITYGFVMAIIGTSGYWIYSGTYSIGIIFLFIFLALFKRGLSHRGLMHSVPMGLTLSLLALYVYGFFYGSDLVPGIYVAIGYFTHLILDEIYSIDFKKRRLKRSFGSALSFYDEDNVPGTIFLYVSIVLMVLFKL